MGTTLVTGGTGTLGRVVVRRLVDAGIDVRVMSRRPRPDGDELPWATADLRTGAGVREALEGVDTVVHAATLNGPRDVAATENLLAALRSQDSPAHLLYVSIVGVDRIPMFYYRAKLRCEQAIEASGVPWTVVRATQFHDLVSTMVTAQKRWPVVMPSGVSFQPVDVRDVAGRLVELVRAGASGRVADFGGPEIRAGRDLAEAVLRAQGSRTRVFSPRIPGRMFAALRRGSNLTPEHADGRITFETFLAERF